MNTLVSAFFSLEWNIARSYPIKILFNIFHIAMIISLFFFISQTLGEIPILKGQYFPYVASGLGFQYFFSGIVNASPSKTIEWRDMGLLESLIHSPQPAWRIFLSAGVYEIMTSVIKCAVIVAGIIYFAAPPIHVLWFTAALLISFSFALVLSLISTCSFLLWKKVSLIEIGGSFSTLFLSGIYFPVDILPKPLQMVAFCNPLYHGLLLFRNGLGIHSPDMESLSITTSLLVLATWLIAATLFSVIFYKYTQKKLLSSGALSHH